MTRVRVCTMRWRCQSSCRTSRFSQLGSQILGKSSFTITSEYASHLPDPSPVCVLASPRNVAKEVLSLPLHPELTDRQIETVCEDLTGAHHAGPEFRPHARPEKPRFSPPWR